MVPWLAAAAAVPLLATSVASAQAAPARPLSVEKTPSGPDFKLPAIAEFTSQSPFQDGMIVDDELASNAHLGFGLVPMSQRKRHSVRIDQEHVPTRNPGVSFVVKFGH